MSEGEAIRIVLPKHDIKAGAGTKVFAGDVELKGISRIDISPIVPDEIITATIHFHAVHVENLTAELKKVAVNRDEWVATLDDPVLRHYPHQSCADKGRGG